jgi:NAD(P)-dependent dehydrogenase (short-subunit alcohol dehydrogenase family)
MLLKNKRILVTGASQGIGKAIARFCIQQGAYVFLHGRDPKTLHTLSEELGEKTAYLAIDLNEKKSASTLVKAASEQFDGLDGLVNNAGIFPRTTWDEASSDHFDTIMTINVRKPMLLSQAAITQFIKQGTPASIVNIGSINAYCGQPDLLIYSMSKGALMTMTRNMADALSQNDIRVNQLNVGWTATETEDRVKQAELGRNWQTRIPKTYAPQGEILKPEHIAPHVAFWLSNLSSPCTGAVYEVEQYPIIGRNRISDIEYEGVAQ